LKTKLLLILFFFGLVVSYTSFQRPALKKASREIASVEEGFDFLSRNELDLLTPEDKRNYLNKISQTIVKAGFFTGTFKSRGTSKVSKNLWKLPKEFSLGVPKAYALYHCPMYGLHPYARGSKEECEEFLPAVLKIASSSASLFSTEFVETAAQRSDDNTVTKCPEGQKMCNPALIGFDFEGGKARLRCLEDASNANCYKLRTSGEQMQKSLDLINKANPKYWDEFTKGIEKQCLDSKGKFNDSDEGCVYAKKQMNYSTKTYRGRLTKAYKDLAAKLNEKAALQAKNQKACVPFTKTDSAFAIADHKNFNAPGFKILYRKDRCWRLPSKVIASRSTDKFKFFLPEGTAGSEDYGEMPVGGVGSDPNRVSDLRFYNFQCGPCNDAKDISACLFNLRKSQSNSKFKKISENTYTHLNPEDCRALITKLQSIKLPDVVFEKASKLSVPFHQSQSID